MSEASITNETAEKKEVNYEKLRTRYQVRPKQLLIRVRPASKTHSSYKPAIHMDSGLSFDASSDVFEGEGLALWVGEGNVKEGKRKGGIHLSILIVQKLPTNERV